ncbi:hypothetical protein IW262DRAFT_1483105 [Armillaria fumosa]|nr:hypothetical protein IW262DRAFT_1483105 [Armillaria fumosa]
MSSKAWGVMMSKTFLCATAIPTLLSVFSLSPLKAQWSIRSNSGVKIEKRNGSTIAVKPKYYSSNAYVSVIATSATGRIDGILEVLMKDLLPAVIPDRLALPSVPVDWSFPFNQYPRIPKIGSEIMEICFSGAATTPVILLKIAPNLSDIPSSVDDSREKHIDAAVREATY